jgi:phosphoribosyl 1,2-cyclic phosphate phosphodiesterase
MRGTFLFLGTAASAGIPVIGCECGVCTSSSPYNQRLRTAGVVKVAGRTLLIDIGPDFRQQALKAKIDAPSGLLLTHTHYDHIAGIDELRIFNVRAKKPFPCLLSRESQADLKQRYAYLFRPTRDDASTPAQLALQVLDGDAGEAEFLGVKIGYMSYFQGGMKVNGFRIGDFAYVSDIREYTDSVFHALQGVRKLVLSALRLEPSRVHFSLDEAVAFARRVGAEETRLTHLSHSVEHESTNRALPPEVQLGHDGLAMEFTYR